MKACFTGRHVKWSSVNTEQMAEDILFVLFQSSELFLECLMKINCRRWMLTVPRYSSHC